MASRILPTPLLFPSSVESNSMIVRQANMNACQQAQVFPSAAPSAADACNGMANGDDEKHQYRDFGTTDLSLIEGEIEAPESKRKGPRGGVALPFPVRLFKMLESVEKEGLSDIVSWQPHGRCFLVRDTKTFVGDILPRYFRQSKIASFQRQLNLYGFRRLTRGNDIGGYYHELFLKNRPEICKMIHRTCWKPSAKPCPSGSSEPNLYEYPTCANAIGEERAQGNTDCARLTTTNLQRQLDQDNYHPTSVVSLSSDKSATDSSISDEDDSYLREALTSLADDFSAGEVANDKSTPAVCLWVPDEKRAAIAQSARDNLHLSVLVVDPFKNRKSSKPIPMPLPPALTERDCISRRGAVLVQPPKDTGFFEGLQFHVVDADMELNSFESKLI